MSKRTLILLYSYHHKNTEKVARVLADILKADIKRPDEIQPSTIIDYDLVGIGSGIYGSNHHPSILNFIHSMPPVKLKKAFIFSTCGAPGFAVDGGALDDYLVKVHKQVKQKLQNKGYIVVDEFICPGFNTNKFLKIIGGINKGRPNEKDLQRAELF
ncbi:MAG: flavodoxin family protein, partial [Candidatus Thermoplasmatota archaeon]|nr:flavodoxin family protein [Candidatus Thermoplasmatota archaeon]